LSFPPLDHVLLLMAGGGVAGFVNTLAGGGSFLTVPLLIFLGLPATVANGTNRLSVFAQSLAGFAGFRAEGVSEASLALRILPATLVGSWLGALLAAHASDELFTRAFALIMLLALPVVLLRPTPFAQARPRVSRVPLQLLIYFGLGLYGGAIQAGIGIPLLLALVGIGGLDLVRANSAKVVVTAALTAVALAQFAISGKVVLGYALVLAFGSALGGYAAGRFGARVGERVLRPFLVIAVVLIALRLLLVG
jgi:hypothetical protein